MREVFSFGCRCVYVVLNCAEVFNLCCIIRDECHLYLLLGLDLDDDVLLIGRNNQLDLLPATLLDLRPELLDVEGEALHCHLPCPGVHLHLLNPCRREWPEFRLESTSWQEPGRSYRRQDRARTHAPWNSVNCVWMSRAHWPQWTCTLYTAVLTSTFLSFSAPMPAGADCHCYRTAQRFGHSQLMCKGTDGQGVLMGVSRKLPDVCLLEICWRWFTDSERWLGKQ